MKTTKIFTVNAADNYTLNVKLDFPQAPKSVVIFCQGSGTNTYDNHRQIGDLEFNYFDLFSDEFCKRGIAFCRWNTRGCSTSDTPPDFLTINEKDFRTYLPSTSIEDILSVTAYIKTMPQFENAKVIFMGISEGATLIPFAAQKCNHVSGLLLLSFSYENLKQTLEWQLSGGSSMVNICKWFDYSKKGYVTKEDFETDKYQVRPSVFPDISFEDLDLDKDGRLTEHGFALSLADYKNSVFQAIENNDDEWLKNNYEVRITSKWCKEHFALPPVTEALASLSVPIHIFQGKSDANIPFSDIEKIELDFKNNKKENLFIHSFENHDHDLNYLQFPYYGTISEGLLSVFNTAGTI